jgi:preprotein translocase subunit SecG
MYALVMTIHIVVCIFLIIVVLLQSGKAADLAGAFGGMGSQTAFGPRGSATLLSKATTISAILFMVTSLSLSIMATRNSGLGTSVLDGAAGATTPAAPKTSAPPAGAPVPLNVNTTQTPAPANVPATSTGDPSKVNVDVNKIVVPPAPAAPPTKK